MKEEKLSPIIITLLNTIKEIKISQNEEEEVVLVAYREVKKRFPNDTRLYIVPESIFLKYKNINLYDL